MRILVTGGAGFIGSNFVRMAIRGEFPAITEITVLDKLTYSGVKNNLHLAFGSDNFKFIEGDICDPTITDSLITEVDAVLNFAAESHVDRSILSSTEFVKTNIVGVQVLLDSIKNKNANARFVQISTDEVYGSVSVGSSHEDSTLTPNSPYSASKAGGELLARAYKATHDLDIIITRSSNNYGPHHFPEKLIPLFITNLIEQKKVPIYGSGENIRDWLHVDDNCRGIYKVLTKGRSGETYNIGGGNEYTNIQIASLILSTMGMDKSQIEFVEDRKGHDFRYSLDWNKIKIELEYAPEVDFQFGISETVNWYLQNESWWRPLKEKLRTNY